MTSSFEIFRLEPEGAVRWMDAAASLNQAENRVRQLATQAPGAYIILDSATGEKHIFELLPPASPADGNSGAQDLRPPQWQAAYRDVLEENDPQLLLHKVTQAETAIFHRLQELQTATDAGDEKLAIQSALKILLAVKTEKLNFPGITPGAKQLAREANSAFAPQAVHNCPGTDI